MTPKNSTELFKYKETVAITGGIYSIYKKGIFLWPAGDKSCVVIIGGKNRTIRLKSISKLLKEKKKAMMDPTEEEELLEMQYLSEKTDFTKQKIDKVRKKLSSR